MGPDTLLNQREIQKIVHVNDLVSQLLRTFRFEERRQLTYDRCVRGVCWAVPTLEAD